MLGQRIITVLILLPLVIMAIFLLPLFQFSLLVSIICLAGAWEWTGFMKSMSYLKRILYVVICASIMWFIYTHSLPLDYWHGWVFPGELNEWLHLRDASLITLILGCIWWLIALVLVLTFPLFSQNLNNNFILMAIIGCLILIPTWVALTGIRSIGIAFDFNRGSEMLLFVLCIVWAADTGAFFSGKLFGKHKLAPSVSPKKTIEGVIGGLLLAALIAVYGVRYLSIPESQYLNIAMLTLLIVVFSVIGDLTESIFKRLSGVKDSGNVLPGHGGILDRIDALTSSMPLALLGLSLLSIN